MHTDSTITTLKQHSGNFQSFKNYIKRFKFENRRSIRVIKKRNIKMKKLPGASAWTYGGPPKRITC